MKPDRFQGWILRDPIVAGGGELAKTHILSGNGCLLPFGKTGLGQGEIQRAKGKEHWGNEGFLKLGSTGKIPGAMRVD
jgi:hypothetical protein